MLDGQIALYEVKPLSEVGKICHRAAEIIERDGWFRLGIRPIREPGPAACLSVAISRTCSEKLDGFPRQWLRAYDAALAHLDFQDIDSARAWNDAPERTKEEVIARLRSVR